MFDCKNLKQVHWLMVIANTCNIIITMIITIIIIIKQKHV